MGAAGDEDPVRPLLQAQDTATPLGVLQRHVSTAAVLDVDAGVCVSAYTDPSSRERPFSRARRGHVPFFVRQPAGALWEKEIRERAPMPRLVFRYFG